MAEVTVAEGVLAQGEPWFEDGELTGWSGDPCFVVTRADASAAVEAVVAAARRFCWIDEHGHEVADDDPNRWSYSTPSYVAAFHTADGLALVVDTKGDLVRAQGEAMVAVLTHELAVREVSAHIDAMPRGTPLGEEIPL